jgi:hypothetical protein
LVLDRFFLLTGALYMGALYMGASTHLQHTMKNDDFLLNYCIFLEMPSPRLLPVLMILKYCNVIQYFKWKSTDKQVIIFYIK